MSLRFESGRYPPGRIVVPCVDVLWTHSAVSIFRAATNAPSGTSVYFDQHTFPTIEKRNYLVECFLRSEEEQWLLMIDSDMVPPPDLVARLLNAANDVERDVVAALCFDRYGFPYRSAAGFWRDDRRLNLMPDPERQDEQVRRVDWVGAGCILMWRPVLEALRRDRGRRIFRGVDRDGRATGRGEDEEFCRAAGKAGFGIFCATGIVVGHLGLTNIDLEFVNRFAETQPEVAKPDFHGRIR